MDSMDDILNDKPEEKPAAPVEPVEVEKPTSSRKEYQKKEWAAQGRDPETGMFIPKAGTEEKPKEEAKPEPEKPKEAPRQEFSDKERALLRAAEAERHKRQQLEAELKALKDSKPVEPPKPFWDDPEGSLGNLKKDIEEAKQTARQEGMKTLLRVTEAIARGKYPDFDEKVAAFVTMTQNNPALHAQFLQAPDPAEYAYKAAKQHLELQELGGLEAWKAKKEQEIRAKIEQDLKDKEAKLREERSKLPQSLTDTRSVAPTKPVWSGPTAMDDILGRR